MATPFSFVVELQTKCEALIVDLRFFLLNLWVPQCTLFSVSERISYIAAMLNLNKADKESSLCRLGFQEEHFDLA